MILPLAAPGKNPPDERKRSGAEQEKEALRKGNAKDVPAAGLTVHFPVFKSVLPNILSENRGHTMFALMRDERTECFVSVSNQTSKTYRVLVVPIADSWFHSMPKYPVRLKPQENFQKKLKFGDSARCMGVRVYWLSKGMDAPEFRDFQCRDAGPVPRTGKVIDSIAWKTGKGPLRKTTLESLEDGRRLYEAFMKRDRSTFAALLKAGADPNARIIDDKLSLRSVLQLICLDARNLPDFKSYLDLMMKNSLQLGSSICWTPDFPSDDADLPVVKYLFQHDLNPNKLCYGSIFPLESLLHNPVRCSSKMYALLFQYGADPNIYRYYPVEGKSGKKKYVRKADPSILRLTEGWLPEPEEEVQKAAQVTEYFKILKMFLKAGAKPDTFRDLDPIFEGGQKKEKPAAENILHYLAKRPMTPAGLEILKMMLDSGANPNAADLPDGNTALIYLAKQDTVRARNAARLLIKAGADVQVRNAAKKTAADHAEGKMKALLQHSHEKTWLVPERDSKQ